MANPTPSSEIIHLVTTFVDTLDSLPPSLTRSLSDLKELDAVLSGSLQSITTKLQLLLTMMDSPPPGTILPEGTITYTPFERLKLLREVAEDARVFRLGGEDKIRVATGTCETIATHTSHLSTLSTLLLSFLPSHLLPMLPPPSAPHGYPSSITPSSALARRQIFDYPTINHLGSGSTTRMQGALGMVREHWDMTRGTTNGVRGTGENSRINNHSGNGNSVKRKPMMGMGGSSGSSGMMENGEKMMMQTGTNGGNGMMSGHNKSSVGNNHRGRGDREAGDDKDKDHSRHPNQYTKKKSSGGSNHNNNNNNNNSSSSSNLNPNNYSRFNHNNPPSHSSEAIYSPNVSSNEFAKDKRSRAVLESGISTSSSTGGGNAERNNNNGSTSNSNSNSTGGTRSTGGTSGGTGNGGNSTVASNSYAGMASQEEYNAATLGVGNGSGNGGGGGNGARATKRKGDDSAAASKRRKKGPDHSPDPTPRSVPNPTVAATSANSKAPRRSNSNNVRVVEEVLPLPNLPLEDEGGEVEGEDDGDGQTYCFCNRVSFGEMIGCDGSDCDREWFHLPCVGLQAIPKGQWFCTECQKKVNRRRR